MAIALYLIFLYLSLGLLCALTYFSNETAFRTRKNFCTILVAYPFYQPPFRNGRGAEMRLPR